MYRLLFFAFLLVTTPLFCQQKDFVFGLQSGINYSTTIITNEFENSPIRGDFFIGSSFGLTARHKLFKYKWEWGGFSNYYNGYAEYGLGYTYSGYNYYYENKSIFQEQLSFQVPLLLVTRPAIPKYWYKSFKGKRIYPILKYGFQLNYMPARNIQKKHTFGEAEVIENIQVSNALNVSFVGALGFQKEHKNGKILYIGLSSHTSIFKRITGTVEVEDASGVEINQLAKTGFFFSLDLQYFFGEKPYDFNKRKKKRFGKLPKIIHNPRYYD